jgi:hypothetical protein
VLYYLQLLLRGASLFFLFVDFWNSIHHLLCHSLVQQQFYSPLTIH